MDDVIISLKSMALTKSYENIWLYNSGAMSYLILMPSHE